jgi:hypothetical protein
LLKLKIDLTHRDFPGLEIQLYEAADPHHVRYGQYLSPAQIHDLVSPESKTIEFVKEWLHQAGIEDERWQYNPAKTWIDLPVAVVQAEELLTTQNFVWKRDDGSHLVRTKSRSLPESLHCRVSTIQPSKSWARMSKHLPINEIRSTHFRLAPENLTRDTTSSNQFHRRSLELQRCDAGLPKDFTWHGQLHNQVEWRRTTWGNRIS